MSDFTDYTENELIKHFFRTGSFAKPAGIYIALYTTATNDAGAGTEVTGGSYARVQVGPSDADWDATSGTDGKTANTDVITFPTPTGNWGTVTHFAIMDASTGGNMLYQKALTASRPIDNGDQAPVFSAGDLTVTLD